MAGGYSVTISAKDAASGVFDGVNKRVEQLNKRIEAAQAPFRRLGDSVEKFGKISGLTEIATGFKDIGQAGVSAFQSLSRIVEPLAVITGAASLAGMYKLVSTWGEFGTTLQIAATRAGVSADSLYNLQNAAKLMGVSAETVTQSMTALNDGMRAAAIGANGPFMVALQAIGLKLSDLEKLKPEDRIAAITEALNKKTTNPSDRAAFADMLGVGGLMPIIAAGGRAFDQARAKARSLTGEFSPEMVANAKAFSVAQTGLIQSVTGLGNAVANVLGPALTPMLNQMSDAAVFMRKWLEANGDWLSNEISVKVGEFVTWLKGIDWQKVGNDIWGLVEKADGFAKSLGGWIPVAEGVLAVMAGSWLIGMLMPFAKLTIAVVQLIALIGTGLVSAFTAAGDAAVLFNNRTMGLPVFKTLAVAAGLFTAMSGENAPLVNDLPADSPFRRLSAPPQEGGGSGGPGGVLGWIGQRLGLTGSNSGASGAMGGPTGPTNQQGSVPIDQRRAILDQAVAGTPVPPRLLNALITQESGWRPDAQRRGGSDLGLGQILSSTAADPGYGVQPISTADRLDPNKNARFAAQYLYAKAKAGGMSDAEFGTEAGQRRALTLYNGGGDGNYANNVMRNINTMPPADGPAAPMPTAGAAGAPGATGRVDMNVRVTGADTQVVATASPSIGVKVVNPGLLSQ